MNLQKYIPVQLTLFLIIGILVGYYFTFPLHSILLVLAILIFILLILKYWSNQVFRPIFLFNIIGYILFLGIGIATINIHNQQNNSSRYTQKKVNILSKNMLFLETTKLLKPSGNKQLFYAKITALNNKKCSGKIKVSFWGNKKITIGQQLLANASLSPIHTVSNPHQFDYKKYLQTQQIFHQVSLDTTNCIFLSVNKNFYSQLAVWRQKIAHFFSKNGLKKEELAIVKALILGERQSISKELQQSYANAGVIHILAISGLHIGIIWAIIGFLCKPLRHFSYGKVLSSLIVVIFLWLYALFAGMSPSVVRAVAMFTAITVGSSFNRPTNVYQNLIISMFFLLLIHPYFLFSVGFQMSYVAVFAIVWLQPKFYAFWKPPYKIIDYFWRLTTVSFAAQIGVLPISLFYFHQFPSLFFMANWVVIPLLSIILIVGFLLSSLLFLNISNEFLVQSYGKIISFMNDFVRWISSNEWFLFQNISFSFAKMLFFYFFIISFFYWTNKKYFSRLVFFLIVIIGMQLVFIFEKYQVDTQQKFTIFSVYKNRLQCIQNGKSATFYTSDSIHNTNTIQNYILGENLKKVRLKKQNHYFMFNNQRILVIDSLCNYKYSRIKPDILLLQQSPKVNLDRVINKLHPKLIIADASNYKSFINRYKKTCDNKNIPFYDITQKGAYQLIKNP